MCFLVLFKMLYNPTRADAHSRMASIRTQSPLGQRQDVIRRFMPRIFECISAERLEGGELQLHSFNQRRMHAFEALVYV